MNPYWGNHLLEFIYHFFLRLPKVLLGRVPLASDELQIFVLFAMSISCAMLGVVLVLRKITMLANSLSHTILLGVVLAFLGFSSGGSFLELNLIGYLVASFVTAILTTFTSEFLTKVLKVQEDASIGLVFSAFFSIGIILLTWFSPNAHIGAEIIMGNVDVLMISDLKWLATIALINILIMRLFYKEFLITTFDAQMAKLLKISGVFFNYLLMLQLSATVIGSFRAVGVILVLAYIVGPYLIASLFVHQYKKLLWIAPLVGCLISFVGVALSRHVLSYHKMALSTGGICVTLMAFVYFVSLFIVGVKRKKNYAN